MDNETEIPPASPFSSAAMIRVFELERAKLLSTPDKSLSMSSSSILASEQSEQHLWREERTRLHEAEVYLLDAKAGFDIFVAFMRKNGCEHMTLNSDGVFFRIPEMDKISARIQTEIRRAEDRELADRSMVETINRVTELSLKPSRWQPTDSVLKGSDFIQELQECRSIYSRSVAAYLRLGAASRCKNVDRPDGQRVGLPDLKSLVLPRLECEEEKAKHRLAGDEYLIDVQNILDGACHNILERRECHKIFSMIDKSRAGSIDANSLRDALSLLKVYLTKQEAIATVSALKGDVNASISLKEWTQDVAIKLFQKHLHLSIASTCWSEARNEYKISGAIDCELALIAARGAIEKLAPFDKRERLLGALWGLFIGDSLGFPSDGSINLKAQRRDYDKITSLTVPFTGTQADGGMYLAVHSHLEHIGVEATIFHPYSVDARPGTAEIFGKQHRYFGQAGVHPHLILKEGSSTLTCQIAAVLMRSLIEKQEFERDYFLDVYRLYMVGNPDKDLFIEPYHIEYFERLTNGNKPYYSAGTGKAASEATSSALVQITPLIVFLLPKEEIRDSLIVRGEGEYSYDKLRYSTRHASARVIADSIFDIVYQYVDLFFRSEKLQQFCYQWIKVVKKLLIGGNTKEILLEAAKAADMDLRLFGQLDDAKVVGIIYGCSNLVEHTYPAALYLSMKYVDDLELAMITSANLGGDAANRTAMIGVLLGAAYGCTKVPLRWRIEMTERITYISD